MSDILINFGAIDWIAPSEGIRYKAAVKGNQQIRLLEFSGGYEEKDWCTKGHTFHVLKGEFTLHFREGECRLTAGDVGHIPAGDQYAHKAVLRKNENVTLLMFELL